MLYSMLAQFLMSSKIEILRQQYDEQNQTGFIHILVLMLT